MERDGREVHLVKDGMEISGTKEEPRDRDEGGDIPTTPSTTRNV